MQRFHAFKGVPGPLDDGLPVLNNGGFVRHSESWPSYNNVGIDPLPTLTLYSVSDTKQKDTESCQVQLMGVTPPWIIH